MNLYAYLDSQPELTGQVLTKRPDALPGTWTLVQEQFEATAVPLYRQASVRTRQVSVTLRSTTLALDAFDLLYNRVQDAPAFVTAHPNVRFTSLDLGGSLPPQEDEDAQHGGLVAVVRFALQYHHTPGAS